MQSGGHVAAVTSLVACVLFGSSSPATAQSPGLELDSLLAKPPSPGAIALLATHTSDPKTLERLSAALEDPRPEVRAAAARVVYAAGVSSLREQLRTALAVETEPRVARELLRPVLVFGGRSGPELALETASSLEMGSTVALALAAVQRDRALSHFEALRETPAFPIWTFLSIASRADFDALGPLTARALRESDATYWEAFLDIARSRREPVDGGNLVFTMSASSAELRLATLWFLAQKVAEGGGMLPTVEEALRERVRLRSEIEGVEERFLLGLVARAWGEPIQEDVDWIQRREAQQTGPVSDVPRGVLMLLTEKERKALAEQLWDDDETYDWIEDARNEPTTLTEATPSGRQRTRTEPVLATVGGYPPGFVEDLLDVSSCVPRSEDRVSAEATYSMDGRPIHVQLPETTGLTPGCWSAARALLLTHVVPTIQLTHEAAWNQLVVFFDKEFLSSLPDVGILEGALYSEGGRITRPKVTHQTRFDFFAIQDYIEEGARVSLFCQMIVDSTGRVRNAALLDPVDNELDWIILKESSQWRFEPARFEDRPIPIVLGYRFRFMNTFRFR